jgi:hypothetical protein
MATQLARWMVGRWGMSEEVGPVDVRESDEHPFLGREIAQPRSFSEDTAAAADKAVRRYLTEAEERATWQTPLGRKNENAHQHCKHGSRRRRRQRPDARVRRSGARPAGGQHPDAEQRQLQHVSAVQRRAFRFLEKEGITVNLLPSETTIPFVAFLQNGDADLVVLDSAQVLQAADQGLPIKVVYETYNFAPEGIVVTADSPIQSLQDLKDTTIGMASDRDLITTMITLDSIGASVLALTADSQGAANQSICGHERRYLHVREPGGSGLA